MGFIKKYGFLVFFSILMVCSFFYFYTQQAQYKKITSFESCVLAGYAVTPTYPETCSIPGKTFVHENQKRQEDSLQKQVTTIEDSFKNLAYIIDGQKVTFDNGVGLIPPSLAKKNATTTFEISPVQERCDINGDFSPDLVFLIKKQMGGDQAQYYLSSAITLHTGYSGLNALYVDTLVASSTLTYKNNTITIEYLDSHGSKKSKYFIFKNDILEEVVKK